MWGLLRSILLIPSALILAYIAYVISTEGIGREEDRLPAYGMLIFLVLNFVYLLLGDQLFNWRVSRLIDLWFDAKENELRQRADQFRPDK